MNFTAMTVDVIKSIPHGKVATYGQIATLAGNRFGARQVAWILNSLSEKENLPWHRVINSQGKISLKRGAGYEHQKKLLLEEGIKFDKDDRINFKLFLWQPKLKSRA
jgi:methylated-DNA-protein-cysteine methyltransferase related protein